MSTVSPFSLESGCKISALKHIHQTFMPTFFRLFCKTLILKEVGRKDFGNEGKRDSKHTLILLRAHVYVYTWNFAPEPFTLFTFPMKWGIFVGNYGLGEGGEGLKQVSICIDDRNARGKQVSCHSKHLKHNPLYPCLHECKQNHQISQNKRKNSPWRFTKFVKESFKNVKTNFSTSQKIQKSTFEHSQKALAKSGKTSSAF